MRTRRSPRNQEILWRELGNIKPKAKPAPIDPVTMARQTLADPFRSPRDKRAAARVLEREKLRASVADKIKR